MKRKERAVRNCPGVYKEFVVEDDGKEKGTGRYRSTRRASRAGSRKKEQAFFTNFQDAKDFRDFKIEKVVGGAHREKLQIGLTFRELVEDWRLNHFLTIDTSTQETYEKLLPPLGWLDRFTVSAIDNETLLEFGRYLREEYPRTSRRKSYEKELQVLHAILMFYRLEKRAGASYSVPLFDKIRKVTRFVPKADTSAKYLKPEETVVFLKELAKERDPQFQDVATVQYYLAARIGEVLGIMPKAISFKKSEVRIERAVNWHAHSWEPYIKEYPKNKRTRTVPITPDFAVVLERLMVGKAPDQLLFQDGSGSPLNRKTISTAFNRVLRRLGFMHVSGTHFIRKTTATHAKMLTGDIDAVSRFLGHSSTRVTRLYVGEIDEQKQEISRGLGGILNMEGKTNADAETVPLRPAIRVVE